MQIFDLHVEIVPKAENGISIKREIMLWDLAGQTDYQLTHQLFLDETDLAIVLFDPTNPNDPFGGVGHWVKALKKVVSEKCPFLLVAGRVDRGQPTVTQSDLEEYVFEYGFDGYYTTSAKTGEGISSLKKDIIDHIPWNRLPVISPPKLWSDLRNYLLDRRNNSTEVLIRRSGLLFNFESKSFDEKNDSSIFKTGAIGAVIRHEQAQGLMWPLSFGDFILLKPELLNSYVSAIVRAARKNTNGLGAVLEQDVLEGNINLSGILRATDVSTEKSLLHAVVELCLNRAIALREGG